MLEFHEGGCVCRAIRYRVEGQPVRAYVCNCTFCQKFTGSAFGILSWFKEDNVLVECGDIGTYDHTVDGTDRWFRLHFCKRCGTTFMGTNQRRPGIRFIFVGTYDDPNWVELNAFQWIRSKQKWVVPPDTMDHFEKGALPGPLVL